MNYKLNAIHNTLNRDIKSNDTVSHSKLDEINNKLDEVDAKLNNIDTVSEKLDLVVQKLQELINLTGGGDGGDGGDGDYDYGGDGDDFTSIINNNDPSDTLLVSGAAYVYTWEFFTGLDTTYDLFAITNSVAEVDFVKIINIFISNDMDETNILNDINSFAQLNDNQLSIVDLDGQNAIKFSNSMDGNSSQGRLFLEADTTYRFYAKTDYLDIENDVQLSIMSGGFESVYSFAVCPLTYINVVQDSA